MSKNEAAKIAKQANVPRVTIPRSHPDRLKLHLKKKEQKL
jgi:hypothetical protein